MVITIRTLVKGSRLARMLLSTLRRTISSWKPLHSWAKWMNWGCKKKQANQTWGNERVAPIKGDNLGLPTSVLLYSSHRKMWVFIITSSQLLFHNRLWSQVLLYSSHRKMWVFIITSSQLLFYNNSDNHFPVTSNMLHNVQRGKGIQFFLF